MFDEPLLHEAGFAYVLEHAPIVMVRLDAEAHVAAVNDHGRRVLGEAVVGLPFEDCLVWFAEAPDVKAIIADHTDLHRLSVNTHSGMPESLLFRFFPLPGEDTLALGSPDYRELQRMSNEVLTLNQELNDLSRQLHQANAELRELNALKNQFLGMAAHDLRKPIGMIMTYGDFIRDEATNALSDEHQEFLDTILKAAAGMKRLIDNFLDVAVIELGQLRLENALTRVDTVCADILPIVRLLASRKEVELLIELPEAEPFIADAAKLQQVLINLLSNAIEHSEPGKRVWLRAVREEGALLVSVSDEGPGISVEAQQRLFEPFARAGARKTAGERSVGLGLAITRQIVDAHGGRIWVESAPGKGATFYIKLPTEKESRHDF